jgi:hypothetical protein
VRQLGNAICKIIPPFCPIFRNSISLAERKRIFAGEERERERGGEGKMLPFLNVRRGRARKLKLVRKSAPEIAGWRRTTSHVVTKGNRKRERERGGGREGERERERGEGEREREREREREFTASNDAY